MFIWEHFLFLKQKVTGSFVFFLFFLSWSLNGMHFYLFFEWHLVVWIPTALSSSALLWPLSRPVSPKHQGKYSDIVAVLSAQIIANCCLIFHSPSLRKWLQQTLSHTNSALSCWHWHEQMYVFSLYWALQSQTDTWLYGKLTALATGQELDRWGQGYKGFAV